MVKWFVTLKEPKFKESIKAYKDNEEVSLLNYFRKVCTDAAEELGYKPTGSLKEHDIFEIFETLVFRKDIVDECVDILSGVTSSLRLSPKGKYLMEKAIEKLKQILEREGVKIAKVKEVTQPPKWEMMSENGILLEAQCKDSEVMINTDKAFSFEGNAAIYHDIEDFLRDARETCERYPKKEVEEISINEYIENLRKKLEL